MKITPEIQRWLAELQHETVQPLHLKHPCLLVLDMQNEFFLPKGQLPVWGGSAALPHIQRLLEAFRRHRLPVIFTRHICIEPYRHRDALRIAKYISDPDSFLRDGHLNAEIHEAVRPLPVERVLTKFSYSAFFETSLATLLRVWGCPEVVITGVATNICCEATAHDAFFRGFEVVFTIDATGGTSEQAHLATLKNIQMSYGRIALAAEVESALDKECSA